MKGVVAEQAHPAWGCRYPSRPGRGAKDRDRVDATARAVIESAADAIVALTPNAP